MRVRRITAILAGAAALLTSAWAESPEVALQRAIQQESVAGDLKAAIEAYRKIAYRGRRRRCRRARERI